jgi:hypothetical protein
MAFIVRLSEDSLPKRLVVGLECHVAIFLFLPGGLSTTLRCLNYVVFNPLSQDIGHGVQETCRPLSKGLG